jgi:hypothetical protein
MDFRIFFMDYMLRNEECMIHKKDKVSIYFHRSSEQKVLEKVENGLLSCYMTHLMKDEHSCFLALLRDHMNGYLLRMHMLFDRIPNAWDSIANIFKQYVINEVTPLDPDLCRNTMKYRNTHKRRDAAEIRLHFINNK